MAGWRWLAAALASIALAFLAALTLAGVALADGDEQEAAASAALQPTQVVAEIPDGYNQLFPLQWGGGSLYQLKARLGTMGCLANTIWNYDGGEWHGYNQYHVPSTLNAEWLGAYQEFVPAGSLYATCFDICTFSYFDDPRPEDKPCMSPVAFLEDLNPQFFRYPIDESSTCTDDFDPLVKQSALPSMPLYPDTCIVRQKVPGGGGGNAMPPFNIFGDGSTSMYPIYPSLVVVFEPPHDEQTIVFTRLNVNADGTQTVEFPHLNAVATEIHELCHANQSFHIAEQMQPDILREEVVRGASRTVAQWLVTEPGRAFVDLVGFAHDADWNWSLPDDTYDSKYKYIYGSDSPIELSAELCTGYFLRRIGQEALAPGYPNILGAKGGSARYLTPEIVEWIETWVALPEIAAHATD